MVSEKSNHMMGNLFHMLAWIQAFSTLALVGLIWTIQIVHYPLFSLVGDRQYAEYQAQHMRRISLVVGPLMLTEAGCSLLLLIMAPSNPLALVGFVLVVAVWLSTVCLQMPCHSKLARGFDAETLTKLVGSNWIRTVAWTARGVIALAMLINSVD